MTIGLLRGESLFTLQVEWPRSTPRYILRVTQLSVLLITRPFTYAFLGNSSDPGVLRDNSSDPGVPRDNSSVASVNGVSKTFSLVSIIIEKCYLRPKITNGVYF